MPKELDFFDSMLAEMSTAVVSTETMGIVEFAQEILFNGDDIKLFPTQTAILNQWKKEDRSTWVDNRKYISLILEAGRRASKMQALTEYIMTPEGYKLFGDIHPGDYVFTPEGKPTKVLAETEVVYDEKTYKLTFQNGETVICGANHLWKTWDKAAIKAYARAKNPTVHLYIFLKKI